MKAKTTLLISIALTAFLLVVVASVVTNVSASNNGSAAPMDDAQIQQIISDREAAYNQVLDEANSRIAELQAELESQPVTPPSAESAPQSAFTPEQALTIAESVIPPGTTPIKAPELVNFEGRAAYELAYPQGNVYIDANNGTVLFNGTITFAPPTINANDAATIASNYLDNDDIYNVKTTTLNGESVYAVKFKNGDVVFVSESGELLLVRLNSSGGGGGGGGEYDDDHEHEDHDDD